MLQNAVSKTNISFMINDVARLFRQSFDSAIERSCLDMTSGEARALAYISAHEGKQQSVIASLMGVEPMTISVYIDSLQAKGLIIRGQKHDDRRAKIIHTTEKGKKLHTEICPIANEIFEKAIADLSSEQVRILEVCVVAMRKNLSV